MVSYTYGCTDINSINYDSSANKDDGSCIKKVYGCMDKDALNYNEFANITNGNCQYQEIISKTTSNKSISSSDENDDNSGTIIVSLGAIGTAIYLMTRKNKF